MTSSFGRRGIPQLEEATVGRGRGRRLKKGGRHEDGNSREISSAERPRTISRNRAGDIVEADGGGKGAEKEEKKEGEQRRRSLVGAKYGACNVSRDDQGR